MIGYINDRDIYKISSLGRYIYVYKDYAPGRVPIKLNYKYIYKDILREGSYLCATNVLTYQRNTNMLLLLRK